MIQTIGSCGQQKIEQQDWLILSDSATSPTPKTEDSLLDRGLFVTELSLPLTAPALLMEFRSSDGWPRTFALFYEPTVGIVLLHRQGQVITRHVLPGPLPEGKGQARVSYRFDAPARKWDLSFEILDLTEDGAPNLARKIRASGHDPLPVRLGDISALATRAFGTHRDPAILWFGMNKGGSLPRRMPWVGQRTPIETNLGPRLAGHLQPGDQVRTMDGEFVPLRRVRHVDLPSRGSFAPVFLRAPFFGEKTDLLLAADQQIVLSGPEVEYLFGQEDVLVKAGDLVDGQTAILDQRRAMTRSVSLGFDQAVVAMADGCAVLFQSSEKASANLALRCLHHFEAMTLMALWGRAAKGRSASTRMA